MNPRPLVELNEVARHYRPGGQAVRALDGVSLTVHAGEYLAIMGASGSGKSTLLNVLGLLDRPTSGRYVLDGREVENLDDRDLSNLRNELFGFVFQQFHLLPRLSAQKNVMLPLVYSSVYPPDAAGKAARMLAAVGLGSKLNSRPGELSGGQQQRVAIARALINDPKVILADEPTGNLDRSSGGEILEIFRTLNQQGRTIIIVTHDQSVAAQTKRVVLLSDGRVVRDGPPEATPEGGPAGNGGASA